MYLNTKKLINELSGTNKSFITRVSKTQEEKYGNVDIFQARIGATYVDMYFGDYHIMFSFNSENEVWDTTGNGQGHKYHKSLEKCAIELYKKYRS
jgi:hypothetical protein